MINETLPVWNGIIDQNASLVRYSSKCVDFVTQTIDLDCLIDDGVFKVGKMFLYISCFLFFLIHFRDIVVKTAPAWEYAYDLMPKVFVMVLVVASLYLNGIFNKFQLVFGMILFYIVYFLILAIIEHEANRKNPS